MHYAFGWYVFNARKLPVASTSIEGSQRTSKHEGAIGAPLYQMHGEGEETITISGTVAPGINGDTGDLAVLHRIRRSGKTYPLITGQGKVLGRFFIDSINEGHAEYWPNGEPKELSFSVKFIRDFDLSNGGNLFDTIGEAVAGALRAVV